jgi:TRAP-type C4-dicarboxylate transport system permease small subunit
LFKAIKKVSFLKVAVFAVLFAVMLSAAFFVFDGKKEEPVHAATYTVTYSSNTGGTLTVTNYSSGAAITSGSAVESGTSISWSIFTNVRGYRIGSYVINGTTTTPSHNVNNSYYFWDDLQDRGSLTVTQNTTITVNFISTAYQKILAGARRIDNAYYDSYVKVGDIVYSSYSGETINFQAPRATAFSLKVNPTAGWKCWTFNVQYFDYQYGVQGWWTQEAYTTVDSNGVGTLNYSYLDTDYVIIAYMEEKPSFTITASVGSGDSTGTISPSGDVKVLTGASQTFTATAKSGYAFNYFIVDGSSSYIYNSSYTFSNVTGNHTIVACFKVSAYTITASAGTGGSISPGTTSVASGGSQTFYAYSNTGYSFSYFLIDNSSYSYNSSYTFSNVTGNHTIVAYFTINQYSISASAASGGSISPSGTSYVNYGSNSSTYTAYPSTGYSFSYFYIDNGSYSYSSSYYFSGVSSSHTIVAYFTINQYAITSSAGTGGSISPNGTTYVNYNASQSFSANPSTGYVFDYFWIDNGSSYSASSTYTFSNVTSTHSIVAYFKTASYNIVASTTTGGSISSAGTTVVNYGGSSPTYTATSSTGYTFNYFLIDNSSQYSSSNAYQFTGVTGSHTIVAYFKINTYTITPSTTTGGTISPSTAGSVNHGSSSSAYTASPSAGYEFDYFKIDGTATQYTTNPYTFTNVITGHTIEAHFKFATYTIDTTAGAGGWIDPSTTITYNGSSVTINFGANTRFNILEVKINGVTNAAAKANGYYTVPSTVTTNQTVSVTFIATYDITASVTGNGAIAPSGTTTVDEGGSKSYTFTPDSGNSVLNILIDGIALSGAALTSAIAGYTFSNVTADHTIAVEYRPNNSPYYTITATAVGDGTIIPGTINIILGDGRLFTFVPDNGQYILSIVVDGEALDAAALSNAISNGYQFTNVTSDRTIEVTFVPNGVTTYTITAITVGDGTVLPGTMNVPSNSNRLYTFVPDNGYKVLSIVVDGAALNVSELAAAISGGYLFSNVTSDHTIEVTFVPDLATTYTITAITVGDGTILPGTIDVLAGTDRLYTFVPNSAHRVLSIVVDGIALTAAELADAILNGYQFTNVTSDRTIEVTFVPNGVMTYTITAITIGNGTVIPGTMDVPSNSDRLYTFVPDNHYMVLSIIVDGNSLSGGDLTDAINNGYLFSNITADHTIRVEFVLDSATTYKIVSTATVGGNITPLGTIYVVSGNSIKYIVEANSGYLVLNIIVDGAALSEAQIADVITYGYIFGIVNDDHTIDVEFARDTDTLYKITSTVVGNGKVLPGTVRVISGTDRLFTFVPDTGYKVLSIVVDGIALSVSDLADAILYGYQFTNITADHEIEVTFVSETAITYTITAVTIGDGTIKPGTMDVLEGSDRLYTFVPGSGQKVLSIVVDGLALTAAELADAILNGYLFANITANHEIEVTFVSITATTYTITAVTVGNGTVKPGTMNVLSGSNRLYTFVPGNGQKVLSIVVDGIALTVSDLADAILYGYQFTNITADHEIEVTFVSESAITYTITAIAIGDGVVKPGTMNVLSGSDRLYTFVPGSGQKVLSIVVDGLALTAAELADAILNGYLFANITANHEIEVTFVSTTATTYTITAVTVGNGIVKPGTIAVLEGSNRLYTFVPGNGQIVLNIIVDGIALSEAEISDAALYGYTFTNITDNHKIIAEFASESATTHKITSTTTAGGTIIPLGTVSVVDGGSYTFTIVEHTSYLILNIIVDGVALNTAQKNDALTYGYTFSGVTVDHTIDIEFALDTATTYTITSTTTVGGSVTPLGTIYVVSGNNITYRITPFSGYRVLNVTVDGTVLTDTEIGLAIANGYIFSGVIGDHTIDVEFASNVVNVYNIAAMATNGGTITPSGITYVVKGNSITYRILPNIGYRVLNLVVNGIALTEMQIADALVNGYRFNSVNANQTIDVEFVLESETNLYTIDTTATAGGKVTPLGLIWVIGGNSITYKIAPYMGYKVLNIIIDGVSLSAAEISEVLTNGYTFSNVSDNHTVEAEFASETAIIYTITATSDIGGRVVPSGTISIVSGDSRRFTITVDTDYNILNIIIDGVAQNAVQISGIWMNGYEFVNVSVNHIIEVEFVLESDAIYAITATAGAGGKITPSGTLSVIEGSDRKLLITADDGYEINSITIDGVLLSKAEIEAILANGYYLFENITGDHTIEIAFEKIKDFKSIWLWSLFGSANAVGALMMIVRKKNNK